MALDNQRLMREKDQLAAHDGLTGVFNRTYLEMALERTSKDLRRNGGTASVLFLDVDDLKKVNDGNGHAAGDLLLRDMAAVLLADLPRERHRRRATAATSSSSSCPPPTRTARSASPTR